ncbi:XylR family transcriptional regulator [Luteolibacter arcticus]|uniref:XylR family transcriptional regulator n=1 Tax=Luteolibacter arcticus TaxID=1581411 RepID=A0ABT3GHM6_9BACT|nr:XylR family transcriptional regulator [Luteolibacter arcticus]MCW1922659.1 XylR family transcriptional regulator [Luteolibacter arcticus]
MEKGFILPVPQRVGIRLIDWAQGFGYRLYGGILDFMRAGHPLELEFEQPSGSDIKPVKIDKNWKGDGLLVFRYTAEEAKEWRRHKIPVVNLSTEQPPRLAGFPRVTLDNARAGEMAAEHLLNLGLRQFAFLHDSNRLYSRERMEGFRRRLDEAGFPLHVIDIPSSTFPPKIRAKQNLEMAWRQLARLPQPCGLFAKDDIAAVMAIRALREIGLRVPQDVPVLGVADDIVHCLATTPPISSLRFPGKAIGFAAAQLLYRQMSGEKIDPREHLRIPPRGVVVRESTGHVELLDPIVTRALAVIREEAGRQAITAQELCRRVGVSRESLRLRFHETLGRSPKQEVDRQRADLVGEILRRQNWTLERIAQHCGFTGSDELCRFFKRVKGCTAGSWRSG